MWRRAVWVARNHKCGAGQFGWRGTTNVAQGSLGGAEPQMWRRAVWVAAQTRRTAVVVSARGEVSTERCAPKVPRANPSAKGAPPKCREPTPRRKVRPQSAESQPLGERCAPKVLRANPSAKGRPQSAESQPLGERARGQKKAGAAWERIPRRLHQLLVRLSVKSCDTYPLAAPSSRLRFVSGLQCQSGSGGLPRENTSHLTAASRKKR